MRHAQPLRRSQTHPIILLCTLAFVTLLHAQQTQPLRWGADSEGGAPFVFTAHDDADRMLGFEFDLVNALARVLGRESVFIQSQWDGLVPGLEIDNYEIIVNGLEITADRAEVINFSTPYYVTFEQLTVRKNTYDINSLKDCVGKVVGTLKASLAERILQAETGIQIRAYDGQITAYEDLALGRIDAVLMDHPIALYYGATNPALKFVGQPIGRMEYGIGLRKQDKALLHDINLALEQLKNDGTLRRIYDHWNMWTPMMANFFGDYEASQTQPEGWQEFLRGIGGEKTWKQQALQYLGYVPLLARGAMMTLALSITSMIFAVILGLLLALMRLYTPPPFSTFAVTFIELIRGTPLLIQLYIIYFGLSKIGLPLTPFVAAVAGLALNYAAYEAENYRAGIVSIPRSQMEAALALGMTRWQALRYVIVPQAMRLVLPPVTNDFISLIKDSSLVSVITMVELTREYGRLASIHFDYLGIGLLAAAMYFLIGLPFVRLARWAEEFFSVDKRAAIAPKSA